MIYIYIYTYVEHRHNYIAVWDNCVKDLLHTVYSLEETIDQSGVRVDIDIEESWSGR